MSHVSGMVTSYPKVAAGLISLRDQNGPGMSPVPSPYLLLRENKASIGNIVVELAISTEYIYFLKV